MSAFMVNEDTLDLLASVPYWKNSGLYVWINDNTLPPRSDLRTEEGNGYRYIEYKTSDAKHIKEELRLENRASLWARYPKDADEMFSAGEYFSAIYSDQASYAEILGALTCYEYQANESENWLNSYAYAICQGIRRAICNLICEGHWEYDRPEGMPKRVALTDLIG